MFGRLFGACGLCVLVLSWSGSLSAQVVTYGPPIVVQANQPVPRTTYYVPSTVPHTTYYAPTTVYYAAPRVPQRVSTYNSSVSSMPVASLPSGEYVGAATAVPVGAPPVASLEPPAITLRPVFEAPAPVVVQPAPQTVTVLRPVVAPPPTIVSVPAAPVVTTLRPVTVAAEPVPVAPVVAAPAYYYAPQSYVMTRGLFGRPRWYPVNSAPAIVVPAYVP